MEPVLVTTGLSFAYGRAAAVTDDQAFSRTWVYVGHASQIPNPGDYYTTTIGVQPVVMVRHSDRSIHVLYNRCPHKGVKIAGEVCGNTGKFFRCPYHAWSFHTDGKLLAIPLRKGYENTGFENGQAIRGLKPVGGLSVYRDFIFARLSPDGETFDDYFGDSLSTIDNMVDRSPEGRLEIVSGVFRYMHGCNWKMLVENQTDTCHPMVAHESSAGTTISIWKAEGKGPKPMAVEVIEPFMSPYEFSEGMGIRIWRNGHGHTGVHKSIHSDYSAIPGYWEQMVSAYGETRAAEILGENRHNTTYFPNMMLKGPIQTLRLFKPISASKTLGRIMVFPARWSAGLIAGADADLQQVDQRTHVNRRP